MGSAANDKRRRSGLIATALVAVIIGLSLFASSSVERLENDSIDARFTMRGTQSAPTGVAVVGVDAKSFQALDQRWPFPRSLHGRLLDRLQEDGVNTVVFDIQFTEPTTPREDNALVSAVARTTRAGIPVILATEETDRQGNTNVFGGDDVLLSIGARAANSAFEPDSDGVWRRVEPELDRLETISLAAVEEATGRKLEASDFPANGALIDFAGSAGTISTYSFSDVLSGRVGRSELAGRTVVVGATSPTLQDVHAVSVGGGELMPGAEVMANAIATVERGFPLSDAPWSVGALIVILFAAWVPVAASRVPSRTGRLVTAGIISGIFYLVLCQLMFEAGVVIPLVAPMLALAVALVGTIAVQYTVEAFERQRVRDTFARFVPAGVVDQVMEETGGDLRAGAVRRECSVLFSDLRGFTTFAETRPPDEVVEILNRYLGAMTDAIMDHGGAIVSYMGDGIMAVFGAPLEQIDHADRAVAAAREMLGSRMDEFNLWAIENGAQTPFRMGVGINTGPVMAGQVGSAQRVEFAAIGDTTNTAARLEGMTKESDNDLFVSDSTVETMESPPGDLIEVGEFEVRGRSGKIRVWSVEAD